MTLNKANGPLAFFSISAASPAVSTTCSARSTVRLMAEISLATSTSTTISVTRNSVSTVETIITRMDSAFCIQINPYATQLILLEDFLQMLAEARTNVFALHGDIEHRHQIPQLITGVHAAAVLDFTAIKRPTIG